MCNYEMDGRRLIVFISIQSCFAGCVFPMHDHDDGLWNCVSETTTGQQTERQGKKVQRCTARRFTTTQQGGIL